MTDYTFLLKDSWFQKNWDLAGNKRYVTFKLALNLLMQTKDNPIIVETGTNWFNDMGGGRSTNIFGEYLKHYGGKLWTVDIQQKCIDACKEFTKDLKENIEYVCDDSIHFLDIFNKPIDLIYLDSFDYPIEAVVPGATDKPQKQIDQEISDCQNHQLKEIKLVYSKLHSGSIVLLDDNNLPGGGKTRLAKEFLIEKGIKLIYDEDQQSIWQI